MMKRRNMALLVLPLMASLCVGNTYARGSHDNHNGFIAGACAVGAGLLAAAGAVALVDWCCSETDDQLIRRVSKEFHSISSQYQQTMDYFGPQAGVGIHMPQRPIQYIPETVLYEFATFVWNSGTSQADYRSRVWSAKHTLQSCMKDLDKRIRSLERKHDTYQDQKHWASMRNLLRNCEQLWADITLFADCLECHKTYFTLYDSVGHIRNRYLSHITILESERYSIAAEIKRYIIGCDNSQYAFKNFVKDINSEIAELESNVRYLKYNYDAGRRYAHLLINHLMTIKNIVVSDPRYQEELYQWEQARLERQRIEALEAQARLERDRIRILQQQNRILEEHNRLERQKMYARPVVVMPPVVEEISVTVTF